MLFSGVSSNQSTPCMLTQLHVRIPMTSYRYYEFMLEANWRTERVANITEHIVTRSLRRYGFDAVVPEVVTAWEQLVGSAYSQDLSTQDGTGVPHLGSNEAWSWEASDKFRVQCQSRSMSNLSLLHDAPSILIVISLAPQMLKACIDESRYCRKG